MTQSPEYPDLLWVPPKAWESSNRRPRWIVIHTTEGAKSGLAAEDGAAYNARRTDSTSCHYHVDNNSVVQSVRTKDVSYCAFYEGNMGGIQYELCTQGDSANWSDAYHSAMLDLAARQIARDCKKWGIEVRRLTVPALQGKSVTGFCGHVDISAAFEGDHHDPGKNFPWTSFLARVKGYMEEDPLASITIAQIRDAARDGARDYAWDAINALRNNDAYKNASVDRQGEMRNARDLQIELVRAAVKQELEAQGAKVPPKA